MNNLCANMFALTKNDTSVLKGIAIIAMLCHHLFTCHPAWVESYPTPLIIIGTLGKICVAMFLFCSGYGLSIQYDKTISTSSGMFYTIRSTIAFILKRLIKFYTAYWFVFLVFVPITILFFNRSLADAYGENVSITKCLLYDILGLQGFQSYNITWWFNKLIILLYFLFPILFVFVKKTKWFGLLLCFIIMRFAKKLEILDYYDLLFWQFPFVLGIGWTIYQDKIAQYSKWMEKYVGVFGVGLIILMSFCILQRLYNIVPFGQINGARMDGFLSVLLALFVIIFLRKWKCCYTALAFLGKHSINIYLVHTFLIQYWYDVSKFLHANKICRMGGVNFWILLLSCLLISILLEYIKDKLYWNKLTEKVLTRIK